MKPLNTACAFLMGVVIGQFQPTSSLTRLARIHPTQQVLLEAFNRYC